MEAILLSMALLGAGEVNFADLTDPAPIVKSQKEVIKSEVNTDEAFRESIRGSQRYNDWLNRSRGGYSSGYNNGRQGLFSRLRRR